MSFRLTACGLRPTAGSHVRLAASNADCADRRHAAGSLPRRRAALVVASAVFLLALAAMASAQDVPELTQPVNDFAHVIDPASTAAMDRSIRALQQATGDVVVVATVETFAPFGDIREYALKMAENHGRAIGEKDKQNGLLVLLAVKDRQVRIEVGYGLEEIITDGYSGETSREFMVPEFRQGRYGAGLEAGVNRIIGRIAEKRNVTLPDVPKPETVRRRSGGVPIGLIFLIVIIVLIAASNMRGPRFPGGGYGGIRRSGWGGGGWSGWSSGVGSFGGGGGGGFGGGFGGFGGGGFGGGGGGASW